MEVQTLWFRGMLEDMKRSVKDWKNVNQVDDYLNKILRKEAYDRSG